MHAALFCPRCGAALVEAVPPLDSRVRRMCPACGFVAYQNPKVAAGTLPQSTIAWQNEKGTIGNTHFVAIPVNAKAKEGAQVFADFLLSPEAQARKNDIKVWGDPTVLAVAKLPPDQQAAFTGASVPGSLTLPGPALLEPHATWVALLEAAWLKRYGKG